MSKRDYYEVLGVARDANEADIKKAYKRLAMKYHPDRNPDNKEAEANFKEAAEAYKILSDAERRRAYDQFGHAGVQGAAGGPGGAGFDFSDLGDVFGDIFGDIFGGSRGGARGGSRQQRGSDLVYDLQVSLEDAVHGVKTTIKVPTWTGCQDCAGSGAKKGTSPTTCLQCNGRGQVQMQHGFLAIQQTCPVCHGQGKIIKDPCRTCHAQGRVQERKTLSVKIPAGIDNGDRIRLTGEGEAGLFGAPAGDLYVQVRIKDHPVFTRQGAELHSDVPVSFVTAALGGEITVPTLDGQVVLKIPPETQTGKLFRLRGKGVKTLRGGDVGDLVCRVVVETPVKLNEEQKQTLRRFEELLSKDNKNHSPKACGWFDSVKQFFTKKTERSEP